MLWLFLLPYAASIVAFFVTARYRAPLLPLLAILAAVGIFWVVRAARARHVRHLVKAAILSAVVCLVSLPDWFGVDQVDETESRYRIAKAIENRGDLQAALQGYDDVLRRDPTHALAAARAAGCLQRLGRVQQAVVRYENLLEVHPDYVEVMVNLANLAWRFGDTALAQAYFERAQQTDPWYAQSYGYHAMLRASQGEHRQALRLYAQALRLDPTWEQLRVEKARSLLAIGAAQDALEALRQVPPRIAARHADLQELLGDIQMAMGHRVEAHQAWRRALELAPRNTRVQGKLQGRGERG
jgi:tetratricopeptide (TPR) repeat protein